MSTERVTLSDEEREALVCDCAAGPPSACVVHGVGHDLALHCPDDLVARVEAILADREQALREEIEAIAADALTIAATLVRSQGEDRTRVVDDQKRHLSTIAKGIHHRLARIARGETR